MYLTEEEAKEKRCPQMVWMTRQYRENEIEHDYYYCIASECMMWVEEYETTTAPPLTTADPYRREKTGKGGCGLAH